METQAHGALVDVLGIGVLLLGASGIGKSECALDLVGRGHQLVADDVVRLSAGDDGRPVGTAPEVIRHYIEIRGIGLMHIPDLYGEDAVRHSAPIDLVCRFEAWQPGADYERVGIERPTVRLIGLEVPEIVLPIRPTGSMATLVEAAARDTRQRKRGVNAARRLDERLRALPRTDRGGT